MKPLQPNIKLKKIYDAVRSMSAGMDVDRSLHEDILLVAEWLLKGELSKLTLVK